MQKNSSTIELKIGGGGLSIPTKLPKNSKLYSNKHTIIGQPGKTGIGGTDIKTMKKSNASKTPKRHRSKHKDKIKELELNQTKSVENKQQEMGLDQQA